MTESETKKLIRTLLVKKKQALISKNEDRVRLIEKEITALRLKINGST